MSALVRALVTAWAAVIVLAAPAGASDHLMKINEVFPGSPGGAQFVELLDTAAGETFASPPYRLVVYTGSGARLGAVALPAAELTAGAPAPYLVANAALGGAPDEQLTVPLPARGEVCFTRGPSEMRIHCVFYSCPAAAPFSSEGGSDVTGSLGGTSWSAQRQASGSYGPGAPTPGALNAGLPSLPCEPPPARWGVRGPAGHYSPARGHPLRQEAPTPLEAHAIGEAGRGRHRGGDRLGEGREGQARTEEGHALRAGGHAGEPAAEALPAGREGRSGCPGQRPEGHGEGEGHGDRQIGQRARGEADRQAGALTDHLGEGGGRPISPARDRRPPGAIRGPRT